MVCLMLGIDELRREVAAAGNLGECVCLGDLVGCVMNAQKEKVCNFSNDMISNYLGQSWQEDHSRILNDFQSKFAQILIFSMRLKGRVFNII